MRGRAALAGLLGFVGGAAAGLLLAMLFVYLWFDVFHLPALDDGPKPGISMLGGVVPIAMIIGGTSGAIGLVRRARAGRGLRLWVTAFSLTIALVIAALALIVG